jgi:hypothetical protein
MGKRSGMAGETLAADKLTLDQLNRQIQFLEFRYKSDISASLQRDAFKTLVWLESERERLHGTPAPDRKLARRK